MLKNTKKSKGFLVCRKAKLFEHVPFLTQKNVYIFCARKTMFFFASQKCKAFLKMIILIFNL